MLWCFDVLMQNLTSPHRRYIFLREHEGKFSTTVTTFATQKLISFYPKNIDELRLKMYQKYL
jgi:hypothetical protein